MRSPRVLEFPLGLGLGLHSHQVLDARIQYRPALGNDLFPAGDDGAVDLHRWSVTGSLGYEF